MTTTPTETKLNLPQGDNDSSTGVTPNRKLGKNPCNGQLRRNSSNSNLPIFEDCMNWMRDKTQESTKFAIRVSLALTAASLFILCFSAKDGDAFPDALWIYITAGVVSWQPSPDMGSVLKKAWQRSVGTILGGLLGLGVGAISLLISVHGSPRQAMYIGISNAIVSFAIAYVSCEMGLRGHYSSVLGTFTFGIALLAFYDVEARAAWRVAIFRILNILIGGLIGSLVSLIVFPVSTWNLIESNVTESKRQAGKTIKESFFSFEGGLPSFNSIIQDKTIEDSGHAAYKKGVEDISKVKAMFSLLDYDPIFLRLGKKKRRHLTEMWRIKLGRILRIQTNIICLDNIVRTRLTGDDVLNFELLRKVGNQISTLLDESETKETRDSTALALLETSLPEIRSEIIRHKDDAFNHMVEGSKLTAEEMMKRLSMFDEESTTSMVTLFCMKQTCLFYQLVEALVLRCVRLHRVSETS